MYPADKEEEGRKDPSSDRSGRGRRENPPVTSSSAFASVNASSSASVASPPSLSHLPPRPNLEKQAPTLNFAQNIFRHGQSDGFYVSVCSGVCGVLACFPRFHLLCLFLKIRKILRASHPTFSKPPFFPFVIYYSLEVWQLGSITEVG